MLAGWFLGDACSCSCSMPLVIQDPVIGFNNRYLFSKKEAIVIIIKFIVHICFTQVQHKSMYVYKLNTTKRYIHVYNCLCGLQKQK